MLIHGKWLLWSCLSFSLTLLPGIFVMSQRSSCVTSCFLTWFGTRAALLLPSGPQSSAVCWPCCMEGLSHLDRYQHCINDIYKYISLHTGCIRHTVVPFIPTCAKSTGSKHRIWTISSSKYSWSSICRNTFYWLSCKGKDVVVHSSNPSGSDIYLKFSVLSISHQNRLPAWPFGEIYHPPSFSP